MDRAMQKTAEWIRKHPGCTYTMAGIAKECGLAKSEALRCLRRLVEKGVLRKLTWERFVETDQGSLFPQRFKAGEGRQ